MALGLPHGRSRAPLQNLSSENGDLAPRCLGKRVKRRAVRIQMPQREQVRHHFKVAEAVHLLRPGDRGQPLQDNALESMGDGGTIVARVWRNDCHVGLEIRDTGVGIARHERPKIFNRFHRADESRNRDQGGNGFGLAIAKWIAEADRSEIRVVSSVGGESVFSVEFNRMEPDSLYGT